jgi:hypothetical protein
MWSFDVCLMSPKIEKSGVFMFIESEKHLKRTLSVHFFVK